MLGDSLSVPGIEKSLRINRDCSKPFYAVFLKELGLNKFMTTEIRKRIVENWLKITPLVPPQNLQAHLYIIEQKYYASIPRWETGSLVSKITTQSMELQEQVMQSDESIVRKANTINDLNTTISKVNKLEASAPVVNFMISTNVSEDDLAAGMNEMIDIVPEEEDE